MQNLIIEKTKSTLGISFDAQSGMLTISGSSYPENTLKFFKPLVDWIQQYFLEVTGPLSLRISIDYLNSSSIKFLVDIMDKLENYYTSSGNVEVHWLYREDDEDIRDMGAEIKEDVSFPFFIESIR